MNDPRRPQPYNDQAGTPTDRSRAHMAETLQQALRSLNDERGGAGGMTPETLAELARRAGLTSPNQLADLSRMMGVGGVAGAAEPGVPQHIIFALGEAECALPAEVVQGVERLTDIAAVPNTVPWVLGIVYLRGAIVSVVDLRGFLGFAMQPMTQRSRLLVVTKRDMTIGLVVDGVTEMRSLESELSQKSRGGRPPDWAAPYTQAVLQIEGRHVIALDPERLLYADKMHRYRAEFA